MEQILIGIIGTLSIGIIGWLCITVINHKTRIATLENNDEKLSEDLKVTVNELKVSFEKFQSEVKTEIDKLNSNIMIFTKTETDLLKNMIDKLNGTN